MEEGAGRKVGSCLFTRRPMHAAQTENACGYSASEAGNQVQRWQGENAGNRRRSRLKRYADKLATELLDGASTAGSVSRFFAMRSLRCALRQAADSHAPFTPLGMTVFISSSSRRSAPFSVSVLCVSLLHCEKSGRSGGNSASARSGCAKQRSLLCPLSERCRRHPRFFAVLEFLVLLGQAKSTYYALSFEERAKEDRRAKKSGNRRCSRLKRYADKLAPALLDGASAAGSASRFFAMRSLWCATRNYDFISCVILAGL